MSIESRCDSSPWNLWRAIFGPILLVRPSSLLFLNLGALHICPGLRLKPNSLLFKRHQRASGLPTPQAGEIKSKENAVGLQLAAPVKRTKTVRKGEGRWPWPSPRVAHSFVWAISDKQSGEFRLCYHVFSFWWDVFSKFSRQRTVAKPRGRWKASSGEVALWDLWGDNDTQCASVLDIKIQRKLRSTWIIHRRVEAAIEALWTVAPLWLHHTGCQWWVENFLY